MISGGVAVVPERRADGVAEPEPRVTEHRRTRECHRERYGSPTVGPKSDRGAFQRAEEMDPGNDLLTQPIVIGDEQIDAKVGGAG